MAIKVINMKDAFECRIHGNLLRTPSNQIKDKIGTFNHVVLPSTQSDLPVSGIVKDRHGKFWDWFLENGQVTVMPSN